MNIIERGKAFVQHLFELANRTAWDWRRCPHCGGTDTVKYGTREVYPWTLEGRRKVKIQRHLCHGCTQKAGKKTYSEESPFLVRGSWYAREVHRFAVDHWQHAGSSVRWTVEIVRSLLGKQERWQIWRLFSKEPEEREKCHLSGSSLHRWLDAAGIEARKTVPGQLEGVESSGQVATDGLWARLLGGKKKVVLALVDRVTGVIFPPVVVSGEDSERSWGRIFRRARLSGLEMDCLRGVVSDGAKGLIGYLGRVLSWVNHQRCVFHIWRNLSSELASRVNEAATGLTGAVAKAVKKKVRVELIFLVRGVLDAGSYMEAEAALAKLKAHQLGGKLAAILEEHLDAAMVHLLEYNRTPSQRRSERKRHYRHPGMSPLAVAGAPPGEVSYLDALAV